MNSTILDIEDLKVHFPVKTGVLQKTAGYIKAGDGVSLAIRRGETVGLVGESGCGKTTVGRAIVRLNAPTSGRILYDGKTDLLKMRGEELRRLRQKLQIIFQDPYSSLNPRHTVKGMLCEILTVQMGMSAKEARESTGELLRQVGLSPIYAERYPHEFSGGQRQRVAIAKAIDLLMDLKEQYGNMTYLFISHALNVVEHISDRVAVMYLGQIVELADNEELFSHPLHPYTQALLSAIPILSGRKKRERIILRGEVPGASHMPNGCRFPTRCPQATAICAEAPPALSEKANCHFVRCHLV
jgi:oligopeptide/dipeptide ABC transporter ATP-binding protein